ncbi:hypothetical protein JD844_013144 [Phrynosoma platyrhinos]|uniref:Uncharacterized protein n=1 Tax=Phrynosoma platyrhinos TaxID=52577 RepID=A0ABQ7TKI6_PHRPL|nr:hypothetical protein JD844_013144 [Phrynosoma platyrhinos]
MITLLVAKVKAASKYVDVPMPFSCFLLPLFSSPASLLHSFIQKPGMDVADAYVTFVRHSQDILRDKVNEEMYIERLFDVSKCLLHLGNPRKGETGKCAKMRQEDKSHFEIKYYFEIND